MPLDTVRGLTENRKPPDIQQTVVKLTKEIPYETACELFEDLTGLSLSAPTAPEVTHEVTMG